MVFDFIRLISIMKERGQEVKAKKELDSQKLDEKEIEEPRFTRPRNHQLLDPKTLETNGKAHEYPLV